MPCTRQEGWVGGFYGELVSDGDRCVMKLDPPERRDGVGGVALRSEDFTCVEADGRVEVSKVLSFLQFSCLERGEEGRKCLGGQDII